METAMKQENSSIGNASTNRWLQLIIGIICMAMIANLQYGWTLFVNPISAKYGWSKAAIQVAFTIFVLTETWLVPIEGYLVDRFGPRPVVLVGGILCGIGWVMNSFANTLPMLYVAAAISGIGAGAVYGTCVGNALKWFPDRRGLAAGLTAAGFGAGSALTIIPISAMIKNTGYESAFLYFGIGQGVIVFLLARALKAAPESLRKTAASTTVQQSRREYKPSEIARKPVMFVILTGTVFFAWGEIFSLFPSTCADTFGSKYAAANAGLLYTAKGTAALLVPLSSALTAATGSWHAVVIVASIMNAVAALLAWFVLRPMRRAHMNQVAEESAQAAAVPQPAR